MPFRSFAMKDLPYDNLKQHFKNNWRPVFARMADGSRNSAKTSQDYRPTNAELEKLFDDAMHRMKDRFSFIFASKRSEGWLIGTWYKNTNPMYVRKHGGLKATRRSCPSYYLSATGRTKIILSLKLVSRFIFLFLPFSHSALYLVDPFALELDPSVQYLSAAAAIIRIGVNLISRH